MRTQLIDNGSQCLQMSSKSVTFAIDKGSKIKANNSINININNIINNINKTMDILYNTIQNTLNSFDFAFCLTVNVLTYIIINIINNKNNNIDIKTWGKRLVLLICIIIVGICYYYTGTDLKIIINTAIITPVFWSWVMKPICKYFKIDYKQLNIFD